MPDDRLERQVGMEMMRTGSQDSLERDRASCRCQMKGWRDRLEWELVRTGSQDRVEVNRTRRCQMTGWRERMERELVRAGSRKSSLHRSDKNEASTDRKIRNTGQAQVEGTRLLSKIVVGRKSQRDVVFLG